MSSLFMRYQEEIERLFGSTFITLIENPELGVH
jgi:hypothetical protein